jgi:FkbM family methyltransferase
LLLLVIQQKKGEHEMNNKFTKIVANSFPRKLVWRTGRSLYLAARKEVSNDISTDGEALIQRCIVQKAAEIMESLVLFDVGANIGEWTNHFLELLAKVKSLENYNFHLFEPVHGTYNMLQKGIKSDHQKAVTLNNIALSDVTGETEICIVERCGGRNSLHYSDDVPIINKEMILLTTLDAYMEKHNIPKIHFVKCDTEGHDMSVIEGASKAFKEERILAFQLEYGTHWIYSRRYVKDVFDYFKGTPYSIGKLVPDGIEIYQGWHPELEKFFLTNFIILHNSVKSWFPCISGKFDQSNTYY